MMFHFAGSNPPPVISNRSWITIMSCKWNDETDIIQQSI